MKINRSSITLAAIAVLLAVVINPELRALLLLAEALGGEVLLLLIWLQVRSFWPLIAAYAGKGAASGKVVASTACHALRLCVGGLFPSKGLRLATTAAVFSILQGIESLSVFTFGFLRRWAQSKRVA